MVSSYVPLPFFNVPVMAGSAGPYTFPGPVIIAPAGKSVTVTGVSVKATTAAAVMRHINVVVTNVGVTETEFFDGIAAGQAKFAALVSTATADGDFMDADTCVSPFDDPTNVCANPAIPNGQDGHQPIAVDHQLAGQVFNVVMTITKLDNSTNLVTGSLAINFTV